MRAERKKKNQQAKGIFQRPGSKNWWLRYTDATTRKQLRVSLETEDYAEAVSKAKKERGKTFYERKPAGQSWIDSIETYLAEKIAGKRTDGRSVRPFRPETAVRVRRLLRWFGEFSKVTDPGQVNLEHLQTFYDFYKNPGIDRHVEQRKPRKGYKRQFKIPRVVEEKLPRMRKGSEASARSSILPVEAFLEHLGLLKERISFQKGVRIERREAVVQMPRALQLIEECPRADLKFVLICGFCMGLRKAEIIATRPAWFILSETDGRLEIPGKEIQLLANGEKKLWKTKNGKGRGIPLPPPMMEFLKKHPEYVEKKRLYCLHPEACSAPYRYDPRLPFKGYMKAKGVSDICMHTMRHSFATHLALSPSKDFSVGHLAAWLGDRLETVQTNYFHGEARKGALDAAFTKPEDRKDAEAAKVQETASAVAAEVLKQAKHLPVQPAWEWTENAPAIHVQMYSVEDTVKFFDAFQALVVPEADQSECASLQSDWEEGKLSTERARLIILERGGWIKKTDRS